MILSGILRFLRPTGCPIPTSAQELPFLTVETFATFASIDRGLIKNPDRAVQKRRQLSAAHGVTSVVGCTGCDSD